MAKIIPKTETPFNVYLFITTVFVSLSVILSIIFGLLIGFGISFTLIGILSNLFMADTVPPYNAVILINAFTGIMRVIFPGINLKLPWEHEEKKDDGKKKYIDLKVELKEVCEETYEAKDGMMKTKYVYTIKPDVSPKKDADDESPGDRVIRFNSFEGDAIKSKGRALFSMYLSDHYGTQNQANLLSKKLINDTVHENIKDDLNKFKKEHGVEATFKLEDSDYDEETQKFRDMISKATSFVDAVKKLTDQGIEQLRAEKIIKLMNLGSGYTEQDWNVNVDAPDLRNLQNVSILGGKGGKS